MSQFVTFSNHSPLPASWRWVKLGQVCELNPRRPLIQRQDDIATSFIPMESIDAVSGTVTDLHERPFGEVKKGYTCFSEGDVLFAKITPCMQNGKHAIARGLIDGIGFGTTELHVLRPGEEITAEWIHFFVRQPLLLFEAVEHFTGAVGQQRLPLDYLSNCEIALPSLPEQRRIAVILKEQMAAVEKARAAAQARLEAALALPASFVNESLTTGLTRRYSLDDCLIEVNNGIGAQWSKYPVLGATRGGLAPAKEGVGKSPARYKLVDPVTVFYNPMRILLGSIAMVDESDAPGITSPDYVVVKGRPGILDTRWFYYWFRSAYGANLVESLSRGAVRERILFNRLSGGEIDLPDYNVQKRTSESMRCVRDFIEPLTKELDAINALPAALLCRAFNGEL